MPFVSTGIPKLALAANRIANLPRRVTGRPPINWDPTACSPAAQNAITDAFFSLGNSQIPEIERRGGDWLKLATLMKTKTVGSVSITCDWCRGGAPMSSNQNAQSLQICLDTGVRDYLAAWLVVEVVHLCGGTDLDAWAVKNWLFNVNKSSYPYAYFSLLGSEKDLMCAGGTPVPPWNYRAGQFTVWDNVGGNLWPSDRAHATANVPVPYYGTSLIDGGPPRGLWQWHC
jgi:hypothetical protein